MKGRNALIAIHIIFKAIISVYFDTFFVMYFFKIANYQIVPIVKYYFMLYLFLLIGFILIRNMMKRNIKVPYFRIGISLQALYVAALLLLKENIVNFIIPIGALRGIANGFYYYPNSMLNSEQVSNENRSKVDGVTQTITSIVSILMPVILGVLLTYMDYTAVGKIFILFFIIMFILSFKIQDPPYKNSNLNMKGFWKLLKKEKELRKIVVMPFLGGLTYFSGSYVIIITLIKVINFKTNLALGVVESVCAIIGLLISIIYSLNIDKRKMNKILKIGGILTLGALVFYALYPNLNSFIVVLLINSSFIALITLIDTTIGIDLTNHTKIKKSYKAEYLLAREIALTTSRCIGFTIVLITILLFGNNAINYLLIGLGIIILIESTIVRKFITKN